MLWFVANTSGDNECSIEVSGWSSAMGAPWLRRAPGSRWRLPPGRTTRRRLLLKEVGVGSIFQQGCKFEADELVDALSKREMLVLHREGKHGTPPITQRKLLFHRIGFLINYSVVSCLCSLAVDVGGKSLEHKHNGNLSISSTFFHISVNLIQRQ
eukprot:c53733_g1_i1 orf=187-651(+)